MSRVAWRWAWPAGALVVEYVILSFLVDFPLDGPALPLVSALRLFVPVAIAAAAAGWLVSRGAGTGWPVPPPPRGRVVLATAQLASFVGTALLALQLMGEGAPPLTPGGTALFVAATGVTVALAIATAVPLGWLARTAFERWRMPLLAVAIGVVTWRAASAAEQLWSVLSDGTLRATAAPPPARGERRPHRRRHRPPRSGRLRGAGGARLLGRGRHRPRRALPRGLDRPGAGPAPLPTGPPAPAAGRGRGLAGQRPAHLHPHAGRRLGPRPARLRRPSLQAGLDPLHGAGARWGGDRGARPLVPQAGRSEIVRLRQAPPTPPRPSSPRSSRLWPRRSSRASGPPDRWTAGTARASRRPWGSCSSFADRCPLPPSTGPGCRPCSESLWARPGWRGWRGKGPRPPRWEPLSPPCLPSIERPGWPSGSPDRCSSSRSSRNSPSAASSCPGWSHRTSRRSHPAPGPGPR